MPEKSKNKQEDCRQTKSTTWEENPGTWVLGPSLVT